MGLDDRVRKWADSKKIKKCHCFNFQDTNWSGDSPTTPRSSCANACMCVCFASLFWFWRDLRCVATPSMVINPAWGRKLRFLVFRPYLYCGMGNRFKGFRGVLALAMMTGRALLVDWYGGLDGSRSRTSHKYEGDVNAGILLEGLWSGVDFGAALASLFLSCFCLVNRTFVT